MWRYQKLNWMWVLGIWLGSVGPVWAACPEKSPSGLQSYKQDKARGTWKMLRYQERFPYQPMWPTYKGQTVAWKMTMEAVGKKLSHHRVRRVYLVHGTFVGADGLGVIRLLRSAFPRLSSWGLEGMQRRIKRTHDALAGDHGNFTEVYAKLLEQALGGKIPVKRFLWSSENHHLARLLGAWRLLLQIGDELKTSPLKQGERLLLLGHSHAGQVFSLLTHLRKPSAESVVLWKALTAWWGKSWALERARLERAFQTIQAGSLDIVTLGTPVRYRWAMRKGDRLLHVINHRPTLQARKPLEKVKAGFWSGMWHTRDGDYVQQLGIAGSDILSNTPMSLRLNRELAKTWGAGASPSCLQVLLKKRVRLHQQGHHLLVDYGDASESFFGLNALKTLFGHGIYTERKVMRFTMRQIVASWYR